MSVIGKHIGSNPNYFTSSSVIKKICKKHGTTNAKKFLHREIIIEGEFNNTLLSELEKHYIRLHNTKTPHGYNLTDGGDEGPIEHQFKKGRTSFFKGKKLSPQHIERFGKANKGRKRTQEHIQKVLATKLIKNGGKFPKASEETRRKMRDAKRGKQNPSIGYPKPNAWVKIAQYTKEGVLVKIWDSVKSIREELGIRQSIIVACAKGYPNYNSARGFIWKYI